MLVESTVAGRRPIGESVDFVADMTGKESMNQAMTTVVKVEIASDGDLHYATSEDVFGLNLANRDREALMRDVPKAIELLYLENHHVRVVAKPFVEPAAFPNPVLRDGAFVVETASRHANHAVA